jgi:hypothetical protein
MAMRIDKSLRMNAPPPRLSATVLPTLGSVQLCLSARGDEIELTFEGQSHQRQFIYQPSWMTQQFQQSIDIAKKTPNTLVILPYLDDEKINSLETAGLSGFDLCGNFIFRASGVFLRATGQPNCFHIVQELQNPYLGKAGLLARALLLQADFAQITEVLRFIEARDGKLSRDTVTLAADALERDLVLHSPGQWSKRQGRPLRLASRKLLLKRLAQAWSGVTATVLWRGRIKGDMAALHQQLFANAKQQQVKAIVAGVSSCNHYGAAITDSLFSVYAQDASVLLEGMVSEQTERFPNLEIIQIPDITVLFDPLVKDGINWSSLTQSYLELATHLDPRLHSYTDDLYQQLLVEKP